MSFKAVIVAFSAVLSIALGIEVPTSHTSVISGDGHRYSYGIAHGPPGIGHAVGESFPHGYGGFGAYAPAYGYSTYTIPPTLPVQPIPPHILPIHHFNPYGHYYPHPYF